MKKRYGTWARALLWAVTAAAAAAVVWLSAPGTQRTDVTRQPVRLAAQAAGAVLDVNTAGTDALEELPGIGPALAERITDFRAENGPFDGPEALMAVQGIGPAVWAQMEPFVYFGK